MNNIFSSKSKSEYKSNLEKIDFSFYRDIYFDLSDMDNEKLAKHWRLHGKAEGRYQNLEALLKAFSFDCEGMDAFDPEFYVDLYPDVASVCEGSYVPAYEHFYRYGIKEDRYSSFENFLEDQKLIDLFSSLVVSPKNIFSINKSKGLSVTYKKFIEMLVMDQDIILPITGNNDVDSDFYRDLGKHYELNNNHEKAKKAYLISIMLAESAEVMELIGNHYFRLSDYQGAVNYYDVAIKLGCNGRWIYENLSSCLFELGRYKESMDLLLEGRKKFPEIVLFDEIIDARIGAFWSGRQSTYDALSAMEKRKELMDVTWNDVSFIKSTYEEMYLSFGNKIEKCIANSKKVLIVGDHFIPQCERYRINQKVEQFKLAGYDCKVINWINLSASMSEFAFYDLVIFYRTPAVPEVVKAMTYCDCIGKHVVYEIDDMVFDLEYPAPIESFGGYVSLEQYRDLLKGMALFNSSIRLCDSGIASTRPLANKMRELLKNKACEVHRNGLDSLNSFESVDKNSKQNIDIFYGSGTQAHNSDFIEEVLPSIEKVFDEFPSTRLIVAGYLNLPSDFLGLYKGRVVMLPFLESVQAYWQYLKQADINIAVLKEDFINDCKSELKWFEAACYGVPSVVSATQNYKDVVDDGVNAYLASNCQEWYESLRKLIESDAIRKEVSIAAKNKVISNYSPEIMAISLDNVMNKSIGQGVSND